MCYALQRKKHTELPNLLKLNKRQSKLLQTKAQDSSSESLGVLIFTKLGEITYNMYFKGSL